MFYRGNGSANAHRHGAGQDRVRQGKDEPPTGEIRGSSEEGRKEGRKKGREGVWMRWYTCIQPREGKIRRWVFFYVCMHVHVYMWLTWGVYVHG